MNQIPHSSRPLKLAALTAAVLTSGLFAQSTTPSANSRLEDNTIRLSEVEVVSPRDSAIVAAPTIASLDLLQPSSSISLDFIQNSNAPPMTLRYGNLSSSTATIVRITRMMIAATEPHTIAFFC